MKTLIYITGPAGVGKTSVCRKLLSRTPSAAWLDGDWCWMMNPQVVNDDTKRMVEDNIAYLLRNFLRNPSFATVIFGWGLQRKDILERILARLVGCDFQLIKFSLICSPEELRRRMAEDNREAAAIEASVDSMSLYADTGSIVIDTTSLTVDQIVAQIINHLIRSMRIS